MPLSFLQQTLFCDQRHFWCYQCNWWHDSSDCCILSSLPHWNNDSLTQTRGLLTLTGLELDCSVLQYKKRWWQFIDWTCVCIYAQVAARETEKMQTEWEWLCATKHLFCLQHSSFICPLKGKPAICCKWDKSMWSLLASGSRKTKLWSGTKLCFFIHFKSRKIFATNCYTKMVFAVSFSKLQYMSPTTERWLWNISTFAPDMQ